MKNIIIVSLACVIFLSVTDTKGYRRNGDTENKRIRSLFSKCFDTFNPINTPTVNEIRKDSRMCIVKANSRRKHELNDLESKHFEILKEMQRFKESMKDCESSSNRFRQSDCISDAIEVNHNRVNEISSRYEYNTQIEREIQREKVFCLKNAVANGKARSSASFSVLENCLSSVGR
ncbi:uncharacterized protein LOC129952882 [Eupeodes corollae]|uniref:uncharacterized protein LOC129952882 n=1 Tax=Eupeodes corollae TaxID=290404 RepID=UPI00248FC3E6|nr:uncharacterized protein LOC129952882 [Eupeodes corollae]